MRWIKVTDKMPDVDLFMAYSTYREVEVLSHKRGYIVAESNPHLKWDGSFVMGFTAFGGAPVCFTHWMPLPKPPIEKETGRSIQERGRLS